MSEKLDGMRNETMDNNKNGHLYADALLILTAMIWGSAFVTVKNALDIFSPALLVCIRYALSTLLTALLFRKHLKQIDKKDVLAGAVTGFFLGMAYVIQTIGLDYTSAGKNAFLTATYVVLVPFGCRIIWGEKLERRHYIAAVLMLIGIGLLSLNEESGGLNGGDALSLLCGIFFAAHMMVIPRFQKNTDVYALIVLQFLFCSIFAFAWHLFFEQHQSIVLSWAAAGELFYLVVFSTTLGMSLQNIGESMTRASHAALFLSLESVFGVIFSGIFLHEQITAIMLAGFCAIFAAVAISATAPRNAEIHTKSGM